MATKKQTSQENDPSEPNVKNNSEILFIYEAKLCNPNGDPDDENKPRMDYNRNLNLVSDVRLKRYVRDYLRDYKNLPIFVSKIDDAVINAKTSLTALLEIKNKAKVTITKEQAKTFLEKAIDVRLFGGIVPDVTIGKGNLTFTGPIQFNWGHSLNKITGPMESSSITSHFQSGKITDDEESAKGAGAMGKDYRVAYSLIAFHGIISAKRGEGTHLTNEDIRLLDDAMLHSIPLEATTRSKVGQQPLVYMRVEYNTKDFFVGDLRKYIKLKNKDGKEMPFDETAKIGSIRDYTLDLESLSSKLNGCKDKIATIHLWKHNDLNTKGWSPQDVNISNFSEENVEK
ncbi:MAG: type I-B CRISPR-associated protein Cas7/Csh2 [Candidatus Altiarchaeota archaeon]|nr:type I-B CRISPR-associated protein Cas7/Csh2 [Candidatus Altiarchaeota archaeon]